MTSRLYVRHWCAKLAIGIAASIAVWGTASIAGGEKATVEPTIAQTTTAAIPAPGSVRQPTLRSSDRSDYHLNCEKPKGLDEAQYCDGHESALAAKSQAYWAPWQFIIGICGFIAGSVTIYLAYGAWQEARRSANAAHEALGDSRREAAEQAKRFEAQLLTAKRAAEAAQKSADTLIAAERAYVLFHDTALVAGQSGEAESIDLLWKNFGKSPAFVTEIRVGWGAYDEPPDPKSPLRLPVPLGAVIDAGGIWRRGHITDLAALSALRASGQHIYLFGQITYRDIHQVERHSWFCRLYTGQQFILGMFHDTKLNGYD